MNAGANGGKQAQGKVEAAKVDPKKVPAGTKDAAKDAKVGAAPAKGVNDS